MFHDPTRLPPERVQALRELLPLVGKANRAAIARVRAEHSTLRRLARAGIELLRRSVRTALARPWLTLGLCCAYLFFLVSLAGVGVADEDVTWYLLGRDGLLISTAFAGAAFVAFARMHLREVFHNHFRIDAAGALAKAKPEIFVAQAWADGRLLGCAVSATGAGALWLSPAASTTVRLPCVYLLLRKPDGKLAQQLNVHSGEGYAWFEGSPLLQVQRHAWTRNYFEACQQLGVLKSLGIHREPEGRVAPEASPGPEPDPISDPEPSGMSVTEARELLGVDEHADDAAVKKAWRQAAQHCHPDRYEQVPARMRKLAELETRRINEAYQVLTGGTASASEQEG